MILVQIQIIIALGLFVHLSIQMYLFPSEK